MNICIFVKVYENWLSAIWYVYWMCMCILRSVWLQKSHIPFYSNKVLSIRKYIEWQFRHKITKIKCKGRWLWCKEVGRKIRMSIKIAYRLVYLRWKMEVVNWVWTQKLNLKFFFTLTTIKFEIDCTQTTKSTHFPLWHICTMYFRLAYLFCIFLIIEWNIQQVLWTNNILKKIKSWFNTKLQLWTL